MKYQASPITVEAFKIISVRKIDEYHLIELDNDIEIIATPDMTARINPVIGDYLVIQEDGYKYFNPKNVFERKYHKIEVF